MKDVFYVGLMPKQQGGPRRVLRFDPHAEHGDTLPPRNDLANHSPDGFGWGYGGSGPAQLALAILADALGDDDRALELAQDFKLHLIARLPEESWAINAAQVRRWADDADAPIVIMLASAITIKVDVRALARDLLRDITREAIDIYLEKTAHERN